MKQPLVRELIYRLKQNADSENAVAMQAYMKNQFEFFGVKSQTRKQCLTAVLKCRSISPREDIRSDIKTLWLYPKREAQYLALDLYRRRIKYESKDAIELLHWMIITNSWWDTVDSIASNLVGLISSRFPENKGTHIAHWIDSPNLWLRRTSIIYQLKYRENVDEDFLLRAIQTNIDDKDFFIRKAIGWALRQYSKFNPIFVKQVVETNPLSALSRKEASKYL